VVSITLRQLLSQGIGPHCHLIGSWVGRSVGLDTIEKKNCLCQESNLGHPASSPYLHLLSYPVVVTQLNLIVLVKWYGKIVPVLN
jgi:hypothetical protein